MSNDRSSPELATAPDVAGVVTGWRCWRVLWRADQPVLHSITNNASWTPREALHAECRRRRLWLRTRWLGVNHAVPALGFACGIYAGRAADDLVRYLSPLFNPFTAGETIYAVGRVALWGDVVQAERGWRAACAYPLSLNVLQHSGLRLPRLAGEAMGALKVYGAPVAGIRCTNADDVLAKLARTNASAIQEVAP